MNQHLKQRLVGATVLIVLGIIFLPMILDKPVSIKTEPDTTNIHLTHYKEKQSVKRIPQEVISRYEEAEGKENQQDILDSKKEVKIAKEAKKITKKPKSSSPKLETPPVKANGNPSWAVQMGSFSSKENASHLVKRLKSQKYPAYLEGLETNGKMFYRVRVGPFDSKLKTEKMKQKLDQKEKLKTLVVTLH